MIENGTSLEFSKPIAEYMEAVLTGPTSTATALHRWLTSAPLPKGLHPQPEATWAPIFHDKLMERLVEGLLLLDYLSSLRKRTATAH